MIVSLTWFITLSIISLVVLGAVELASEQALPPRLRTPMGRLATAALSAVVLIAVALAWRVHAVAAGDEHIIRELAKSRGKSFTIVMQTVTTMGDAMPSLLIATIVAILIFRRRREPLAVLLPLAVLVELFVQIAMTNTFHDITVHRLDAGLVLGGAGTIPSGSVARLLSIFLLASHLWQPNDRVSSSRVATLGAILVVIQATSRLFLGRHLCADILGGVLLGIVLERVGYQIICWVRALQHDRRVNTRSGDPLEPPVADVPSNHAPTAAEQLEPSE